MARVRDMRDTFVGHVLDSVEDLPDDIVVKGKVRFADDITLRVGTADGDIAMTAEPVVIAKGSAPTLPKPFDASANAVTTPQIAMTGESVRALRGRGAHVVIRSVDFADQGRAKVMDEAAGRLHRYVERGNSRLLWR